MAGFESREPARLNESLNGYEIKQQIMRICQRALDGEGNLSQSVLYPIYGVNIRLEFFTGDDKVYQKKDWVTEASHTAVVKGVDLTTIAPEDIDRRIFTHEIRVDGVNVPADMVREEVGLPIPIPVATGVQGYVQITMDQMRPKATRTAAEEINDLLNEVKAEEIAAPAAEKPPMKANKLSGAGQRKSMTPQERADKLKALQEG